MEPLNKEIKKIKIGKRCRKDLGDLTDLKKSIQEIGLLHPIVIDENNNLVAGYRRIKAYEELGILYIPVTQIKIKDLIKSECDENVIRKDFTPSEAVEIWGAIKKKKAGRKPKDEMPSDSDGIKEEPRDLAVKYTGYSTDTLSKAKQVIESGNEELTKIMDEKSVDRAYRKMRKEEIEKNAINLPVPTNKFKTLIIDPPWPVQKIIREVRPNQKIDLDYPTMSIEEIKNFPIQKYAHENCHVYLWTTHKHLPNAFEIFKEWNVRYQCLLTWVKNVGFTPFSFMYSTEFVLFGTIGNLPLLKKGERTDFHAKITKHSEKPDIFYDLIRKVSPQPRADIFGRKQRKGFTTISNDNISQRQTN